MLSRQFQQDMPLQMFVYPVDLSTPLPEAFTKYAQIPAQPATLAPDEIATYRDAWIEAWARVME